MTQPPQPTAVSLFKAVPSTGELLPVIGLGTNAFAMALRDPLRQALLQFTAAGASMLDTAAVYGESEQVIGELVSELGLRQRLFIATKITATGNTSTNPQPGGLASFERSLARLQTGYVDLLYVHNLLGADELLPQLLDWKRAGRLRYLGVSSSRNEHHAPMVACMQRHALDFVQVNYGLGDRTAEATVLKTAADRGVAVVANIPLGGRGGHTLASLNARPLPDWAGAHGCTNWAQLLLKYAAAHPAVTCVISGTTSTAHLDQNLQAGSGTLPDAALRRSLEQCW